MLTYLLLQGHHVHTHYGTPDKQLHGAAAVRVYLDKPQEHLITITTADKGRTDSSLNLPHK